MVILTTERSKMKRVICVATAILLTACGSTKTSSVDQYNQRVEAERVQQSQSAQQAITKAPKWMSELPKSKNAVYENGTAVSIDFAMADIMAKTIAYTKICTAAGGKVRSQTKMFGTQDGMTMEMAVRSICPDIDITGVETIEMVHVAEGSKIRTYALVALPIGDANTMRKDSDARADRVTNKERADKAFKDLDERVEGKIEPKSKITLVDVDNEEYKRKRDEALQKPGAVIGQVTLQGN